ncbi:MAG: hypothetical protein QW478_07675 [Candidatus Micrarchaeaceae archaeon]
MSEEKLDNPTVELTIADRGYIFYIKLPHDKMNIAKISRLLRKAEKIIEECRLLDPVYEGIGWSYENTEKGLNVYLDDNVAENEPEEVEISPSRYHPETVIDVLIHVIDSNAEVQKACMRALPLVQKFRNLLP